MPMVEKGDMKVLAVVAPRRTMLAPLIPTLEEAGYPGMEGGGWGALLAPRNTPASIQSKLYDDVRKVLADPGVKSKINQIGTEPVGSTADELRARISQRTCLLGGCGQDVTASPPIDARASSGVRSDPAGCPPLPSFSGPTSYLRRSRATCGACRFTPCLRVTTTMSSLSSRRRKL